MVHHSGTTTSVERLPMTDVHEDPVTLAESAARVCMSYPFAVWDFGDSVFLDALVELARVSTNGAEFSGFAYGMTKGWIAHAKYDIDDHTAPGAAIVELWHRTGDDQLLAAAVELSGVWERFPRCATAEAYLHTFPRHQNVPIDCAHFDGPYFAKLATATGDERYAERAVYELTWRLRLLCDERSGLYHHSYLSGRGRRGPLWGRGQGWALLGLVETLRALPASVDGRPELVQRLERLADALVAHQDASGHWHTVVDDETSYLETSVAAFFVAAVSSAVDDGLLPADRLTAAVESAWAATAKAVDPDGVLDGVSAETPTTLPAAAYKTVPTGGVYPWGQGPLVLAALARARQRST